MRPGCVQCRGLYRVGILGILYARYVSWNLGMLYSGYVSCRNLGNIILQLCIIYECKEYYTSVIFGSLMGGVIQTSVLRLEVI